MNVVEATHIRLLRGTSFASFICKNLFIYLYKNKFLGEKLKKCRFFLQVYLRNSFKVQWISIFRRLHRKKKNLVKKLEIQLIVFMIMLTRSSERIFNPSRCTVISLIKLWNKTLAKLITYGLVLFLKYVYGYVSKNVNELFRTLNRARDQWFSLKCASFIPPDHLYI